MRYRQPSAQWVTEHQWNVFLAPVWPNEHAQVKQCHSNVRERVARDGGRRLDAWEIIELEHAFLQFRPHVLWQRPDGVIVDATPSEFGFHHSTCVKARNGFGLPLPPSRFVPLCEEPEIGELCLVETLAGRIAHDCLRGLARAQPKEALAEECRYRLWEIGLADKELSEKLLRATQRYLRNSQPL